MSENWRAVPGYEGSYEVSDLGRVRSLERMVFNPRWNKSYRVKARVMKPAADLSGYPTLSLHKGGISRSFRVHRLVMLAFVGPRPSGQEIRHLDGNSANPCLSNLQYGTHSENVRDSVRHGTHSETRKTHCYRGHEFPPGDAAFVAVGNGKRKRLCRECRRMRASAKRGTESAPLAHMSRQHSEPRRGTAGLDH